MWVAAATAVAMMAGMISMQVAKPKTIADLVSAENASWESSLPTEPGSPLSKGYMKLTEGIGTIRFRSGAEIMLEAPAKLTMKSAMKAKLFAGAAVMNVPESAIGFELETPQGRVIDHGTSFAVNVTNGDNQSDFEVIEGEISVYLPSTGEEVRLKELESASIIDETLSVHEGALPEKDAAVTPARTLRIGTKGRSHSVIRANKEKWLHPDLLTVKRKREPIPHERRSFFAFDISGINWEQVDTARIRLNQVPSGIGFATRLPKISFVGLYGLTNSAKSEWDQDSTWETGPSMEDGVKLGALEIPRSEQRGSRILENDTLLEFLKAHKEGTVTFIIEREVSPIDGSVPSLVHAFASDLHPEVSGPALEITLKE